MGFFVKSILLGEIWRCMKLDAMFFVSIPTIKYYRTYVMIIIGVSLNKPHKNEVYMNFVCLTVRMFMNDNLQIRIVVIDGAPLIIDC